MSDPDIPQIDVHELARRLGGPIQLVDVREADEYAAGHVPGAQLVPLSQFPEAAVEVPHDGEVHLICARGGRSQKAAQFLAAAHGRSVINVAGGTRDWIDSGYDIEVGPAASTGR